MRRNYNYQQTGYAQSSGRNCNNSQTSCHTLADNVQNCPSHDRVSPGCEGEPHFHKPLAMAYVPLQAWENVFRPCDALEQGTIFKDLVLPFYTTSCPIPAIPKPAQRRGF